MCSHHSTAERCGQLHAMHTMYALNALLLHSTPVPSTTSLFTCDARAMSMLQVQLCTATHDCLHYGGYRQRGAFAICWPPPLASGTIFARLSGDRYTQRESVQHCSNVAAVQHCSALLR
eukprot:TRINITY_DN26923_c0_g1_i1.p1 TRINITY_DN26923_c0_g1~~TRINITY_DN26923_c0_g1_i1.p1  ORF type:complete len:119 (-),score=6.37 TRINITY_DN26923_c0_g1_i1:190-546(-)